MAKKIRNIRMDDETYKEFQDLATPVQIERGTNAVEMEDILQTLIDHYKKTSDIYSGYLKFEGLVRSAIPN